MGSRQCPLQKKPGWNISMHLEAYAVEGDLNPFAEMIAGLVDRQQDCYLKMRQPAQRMDQKQNM